MRLIMNGSNHRGVSPTVKYQFLGTASSETADSDSKSPGK